MSEHTTTKKCWACEGEGVLHTENSSDICPWCNGTKTVIDEPRSEHTPTPWHLHQSGSEGCHIFPDGQANHGGFDALRWIAAVTGRDAQTDRANAEFIVRACNVHDEMLKALKAVDGMECFCSTCMQERIGQVKAAIAKAEGR